MTIAYRAVSIHCALSGSKFQHAYFRGCDPASPVLGGKLVSDVVLQANRVTTFCVPQLIYVHQLFDRWLPAGNKETYYPLYWGAYEGMPITPRCECMYG